MTAGVFCCSARDRLHRSVAAVPKLHVRKQWSHLSVARYLSVFTTHMPRSARGKNKRACKPTIQTYINTYIHTYIHAYISIHPSIHPSMHAYIHAYNTTCLYTTYSYILFHTQLAPHQSFTISFLFPAFPMPSLPFFCCLLEEVDMWGYPVLLFFQPFCCFIGFMFVVPYFLCQ